MGAYEGKDGTARPNAWPKCLNWLSRQLHGEKTRVAVAGKGVRPSRCGGPHQANVPVQVTAESLMLSSRCDSPTSHSFALP